MVVSDNEWTPKKDGVYERWMPIVKERAEKKNLEGQGHVILSDLCLTLSLRDLTDINSQTVQQNVPCNMSMQTTCSTNFVLPVCPKFRISLENLQCAENRPCSHVSHVANFFLLRFCLMHDRNDRAAVIIVNMLMASQS